jgi:hypothetical protein
MSLSALATSVGWVIPASRLSWLGSGMLHSTIANHVPNARLGIYPDAPHGFFLQSLRQFAELVIESLSADVKTDRFRTRLSTW